MLVLGYVKYLPDPSSGMYCLPPNVEQVSREYAEACLRTIASLEVVIRRQAIAARASAPSMVATGCQLRETSPLQQLIPTVQGSKATPSAAGQDAVVYSSVDANNDEDDNEEGIGSEEEDEEDEDNEGEDSESGSSGSEPLRSEDTDNATLVNMTQKTPKRPRKK